MIIGGEAKGTTSFQWATCVQKSGNDPVKTAAFEKKSFVFCVGKFEFKVFTMGRMAVETHPVVGSHLFDI